MENEQQQHRYRYISRSQPSSPLIDPTARFSHSPLRSGCKSFVPEPSRKSLQTNDETLLRGRWPSSSKKSNNSLADYLVNDGLSELSDQKGKATTNSSKSSSFATSEPQSLSRMRSCSEFTRFEVIKKKDEEEDQMSRKISKENRPFGNSMRYISKLKFPKSSLKPDSLQPGRMSVDENALSTRRKATDYGVEIPSLESDRSDSTKSTSPKIPRSRNIVPPAKLAASAVIRRASSGNVKGMSQWALSPGRRPNSPPLSLPVPATDGGGTPSRSFSSLRPPSPDHKHKKVGNIITIGLDLFRRKSGSGSISNKPRPSSPVLSIGDVGYQFRMLHNCLIQWRYVNARSDIANQTRKNLAENALVSAWIEIARLQATVMRKTVQFEREKLNLKLNSVLSWQMKLLEGWGDTERQHTLNLSTTENCLQAAVCRLPLVDRAKADPHILSIRLRQATHLTTTIKTTLEAYTTSAQKTVPLLTKLALAVSKEKTLLNECLEMLEQFCTLHIQEESLRCHLVQLKSSQEKSIISPKVILL